MTEVTRILDGIDRGEAEASDQLLPVVYDELRRLAAGMMEQEQPGNTRSLPRWFTGRTFGSYPRYHEQLTPLLLVPLGERCKPAVHETCQFRRLTVPVHLNIEY